MKQQELVIFDLDDTLVDTSHVYWAARQGFIDALAEQGIDASFLLELFENIDEENIKIFGFVPERYGHTMMEAYERLVRAERLNRSSVVEERLRQCGQIVVTQLPELIEGAKKLLSWASERFKLVLMTRGVEVLQTKKIAYVEIAEYFDDVRIVATKDASHFRSLISDSGYTPQNTWVIGDSIRSDINPALEVGAKCILYVYTHHSYYWRQEYGVSPTHPFFTVDELEKAISILENPRAAKMITPSEWNNTIAAQSANPPNH